MGYRNPANKPYIVPMTEPDTANRPRPVVLCILDGWGDRDETDNNAIALGRTPVWDRFVESKPVAHLQTAALEVGLPQGQMGNSEVGHTNIGAGRIVLQDLPRIDTALADGSLAAKPDLLAFIGALKKSGGTCHLMGLMSPGGVHSHQDHMAALARQIAGAGVPVCVHGFLDGRDTPPKSGAGFMQDFLDSIDGTEGISVGVVSGRYYAMDRDKRWERVEKAYAALVDGTGEAAAEAVGAIEDSYQTGVTDEFMLPTSIGGYPGMADGDGLLMANFRADRAREILTALADPGFDGFARGRTVKFSARLGMVEFSTELKAFYGVLFPPQELHNILGQVVADAGLKQLRIAETEKYAHVTFFLNGGREETFDGEERILVPSPKIATYDLQPEMSAPEVTGKLVEAIGSGQFDLIIVNYANGDMVGHTGMLEAAIKAAETVDSCLGQLADAVTEAGGVMLVSADHGNCEMMTDPETGEPHTAHTLGTVPLVAVNAPDWVQGLEDGRLADLAPTLLHLMGLAKPAEMTGRSLILKDGALTAAAE